MPGTIQATTPLLFDQDTGLQTGYVNPVTGKPSSVSGDGSVTPASVQAALSADQAGARSAMGAASLAANTYTDRQTAPSFELAGNISAASWATSGIGLRSTARTLTDTSSSGVVAAAYTNVLGGNTIAAASATTYTNYASLFVGVPTAGGNVTIINPWAVWLAGAVRTTRVALGASGSAAAPALDLQGGFANTQGFFANGNGDIGLAFNGATRYRFNGGNLRLLDSTGNQQIVFQSQTASIAFGPSEDLVIQRDAQDVYAQRRGNAAQESRVYGSFTDFSNNRRLAQGMSTAGAGFLRAEGAGTGGSGNTLTLGGSQILLDAVTLPRQFTTATRPAWVNGGVIFDSDLDKLLVGGASAWEIVTSS